jgi:outer membrane lipoprotein-sorting protein
MGKSNKKMVSKKLRIILVIVIVLVVLGGGAVAYFGFVAPSMKKATTASTDVTGTKYQTVLRQKQAQIDTLVASGDKNSVQQATQIANSQVAAATDSGNDAYIVDASIAKATVMIQTGQAQEALDSVLLPLDQKYSSNATYKASIYACIAYAYRELGDATNADKYFSQIPGESFSE